MYTLFELACVYLFLHLDNTIGMLSYRLNGFLKNDEEGKELSFGDMKVCRM